LDLNLDIFYIYFSKNRVNILCCKQPSEIFRWDGYVEAYKQHLNQIKAHLKDTRRSTMPQHYSSSYNFRTSHCWGQL